MRQKIYLAGSIILSSAFLIVLIREAGLREVWQLIREAETSYLLMFLGFSLLMNICRTWRYHLLLHAAGESPRAFPLFLAVLVRNCCADLLPAKTGSAVYLWITVSRLGIRIESALSSFFISFIFDLLALIPLLILLIVAMGSAESSATLGFLTLALLFTGIPALLYLPEILRALLWRMQKIAVPEKIILYTEKMIQALNQTKSAGIYFQLFIISIFIRLGKYLGMYAFLLALLTPLNFTLSGAQIPKAFTGLFSAEVAASLPVSGIAGFGAYEGAWLAVFSLLGFPKAVALQTGFAHHLATQAYGYSLGLLALLLLLLPFTANRPEIKPQKRWPSALNFSLLFFFLTMLCIPLFAQNQTSQNSNHNSESDLKNTQTLNLPSLSSELRKYQLYFDSNRSGTFGIYRINLDQGALETISDTPAHEMYPDPDSEGRYLVFAKTWSLARNAPSAIYLLDLEENKETLISDDGTFPSFSPDNSRIIFERKRREIISYDLQSGKEHKIFPLKQFNYEVVKPRLNADQTQAAFISDKGGRWSVWTVQLDTGKASRVTSGCEPFWMNTDLIWIKEQGAINGSGIYKFSSAGESLVQENEGEFGHEYFPVLSHDLQYLTFSAAPNNQHSHLDANYQIFIKNLQNGEVQRITNDQYTNRWARLIKQ